MMDIDDEYSNEERESAREAKAFLERRANDTKVVMSTPEGRRFVWEILEGSGAFLTGVPNEPLGMAYGEGRRSVGIATMGRLITCDPENFVKMQKENENGTSNQHAWR